MHPEAIHPHAKRSLEQLVKTSVFDSFYMAGGTAAAIQLGHRVSVDLDLFSNSEFDPDPEMLVGLTWEEAKNKLREVAANINF